MNHRPATTSAEASLHVRPLRATSTMSATTATTAMRMHTRAYLCIDVERDSRFTCVAVARHAACDRVVALGILVELGVPGGPQCEQGASREEAVAGHAPWEVAVQHNFLERVTVAIHEHIHAQSKVVEEVVVSGALP